jgi:Rps23 Pro-64 3,4-dihydroxylase Tpa1-like proline 4-hydroxylase
MARERFLPSKHSAASGFEGQTPLNEAAIEHALWKPRISAEGICGVVTFELNPDLDLEALARDYSAHGRVRIESLLAEEGAAALYEHLESRQDWWHLINTPDGIVELDRPTRARMSEDELWALDRTINEGARSGFQYRYEGLRVPSREEEAAAGENPLTEFGRLMSSEPMLTMLRAVTGCADVSFTDGQATAYGPGDFLTGHDDDVAGKNRLAAYVFGLTPRWRLEWGGLLLFHGADEASVAGHVPRFNTLDLFKVPQRHSVSIVSPAAPALRYSVTGWLRSGARQA